MGEAAAGGYTDVVAALLEYNVKLDTQTQSGATALMEAALADQPRIADLLLQHGADPNLTQAGWTALTFAAAHGHKDVVQTLLENGADPNAGSQKYGFLPLMQAASAGNKDIVLLLI